MADPSDFEVLLRQPVAGGTVGAIYGLTADEVRQLPPGSFTITKGPSMEPSPTTGQPAVNAAPFQQAAQTSLGVGSAPQIASQAAQRSLHELTGVPTHYDTADPTKMALTAITAAAPAVRAVGSIAGLAPSMVRAGQAGLGVAGALLNMRAHPNEDVWGNPSPGGSTVMGYLKNAIIGAAPALPLAAARYTTRTGEAVAAHLMAEDAKNEAWRFMDQPQIRALPYTGTLDETAKVADTMRRLPGIVGDDDMVNKTANTLTQMAQNPTKVTMDELAQTWNGLQSLSQGKLITKTLYDRLKGAFLQDVGATPEGALLKDAITASAKAGEAERAVPPTEQAAQEMRKRLLQLGGAAVGGGLAYKAAQLLHGMGQPPP